MNWLDIFVLIICIASLLRGYKTGFVMQLASLVGIVLGAIFAGTIAEKIQPHLEGIIGNSENISAPLAYVVGFIVILIAVNLIGRIVSSAVKIVLLGTINRLFGAAFCLGKWILIVSILLNIIVGFDLSKNIIKQDVRDHSKAYPHLIEIAQSVIPYLQFDHLIPDNSDKKGTAPQPTNI